MSSPPNPINRSSIFAESNRIIAANQAHFLALSFLFFFFPLFISLTSLLTFFQLVLSQSNVISLNPLSYYANSSYSIALSLLLSLLVLSLYVAGVATITYSTQQGLYGKPLTLSSTINSLSKSFFPLASTTLTSIACLLSASIAFLLFSASFLNSHQILLGFDINYTSSFFIRFRLITFTVIIGLLLISCHINLTLAAIISVVESKWGFEPLRRSFFLVSGMKRSSLAMLQLRGISLWVTVLGLSTQIFMASPFQWDFLSVFKIVNISMFWITIMFPSVNTHTVLYLNCKDLHEELGYDIAVEISKECVNLAIDDEKLVRETNVKGIVCAAALMMVSVTLLVFARLDITYEIICSKLEC